MSRLRFCLLLAVICSCSHLGASASVKPEEPVIIDVKPIAHDVTTPVITDPTTTVVPDSTTTTEKPTTTTSKPTTTTPTTTTPTTTTSTTPSTTTSTTSTTTTTPPPTPAPVPPSPPTPTPAPGPVPLPTQGKWWWTDSKKNETCVLVQFAAQLNVTYTKNVESGSALAYVLINVPSNASVVDGNCDGDQWLQISWFNVKATVANNLTIVYHMNDTTKSYGVKSLNVSLTPDNFVNASSADSVQLYHGAEWQTPLATSYRCKVPTQLNMSSEASNIAARLTLSSLQEEAYRTIPGDSQFNAPRECGGGDVPDAVPIAVGCALGGLVVVVLVAYLVGRRRSAARGYLSM